jgi:hypothetical protein
MTSACDQSPLQGRRTKPSARATLRLPHPPRWDLRQPMVRRCDSSQVCAFVFGHLFQSRALVSIGCCVFVQGLQRLHHRKRARGVLPRLMTPRASCRMFCPKCNHRLCNATAHLWSPKGASQFCSSHTHTTAFLHPYSVAGWPDRLGLV